MQLEQSTITDITHTLFPFVCFLITFFPSFSFQQLKSLQSPKGFGIGTLHECNRLEAGLQSIQGSVLALKRAQGRCLPTSFKDTDGKYNVLSVSGFQSVGWKCHPA
jgi:hypothetical protein